MPRGKKPVPKGRPCPPEVREKIGETMRDGYANGRLFRRMGPRNGTGPRGRG